MTIAEKLQIVLEQKEAIKAALESKGKAPSNDIRTYAGLINELENDEQNTYVITNADGTQRAYAVKSSDTPVTLTATENDIRLGTTAVTNEGYTEGSKEIPAYHTRTGRKVIFAGNEMSLTLTDFDYTFLQVIVTKLGSTISESVEAYAVVIDDVLYQANSTTKLADVTKDSSTNTINLGITANEDTVLRYFTMREE